ncbi:MAG: 30S ribosomal protein S16 [Planctomycetota bacterium]|jgi:small subunit ribosomal protein S16
MVRIRLTRLGKRNRPFYRVGVFDSRTRRDGRSIELIGYYDPFGKAPEEALKIDMERARHWLNVGAQPSEKAGVLLRKAGLPWPPDSPKKKKKKGKKRASK